MKALKDMRGTVIKVGDTVIKAEAQNRSPHLTIREVTRIEDGRMWLDGSTVPIVYPSRLIVLESKDV